MSSLETRASVIIPVYFSSVLMASEIYADLMAHLPARYSCWRKPGAGKVLLSFSFSFSSRLSSRKRHDGNSPLASRATKFARYQGKREREEERGRVGGRKGISFA